MITLYGISNCDTVRKTGRWLTEAGLTWTLHDYRKHGLDASLLNTLIAQFGAESLLNRRGTTWRHLPAEEQQQADSPEGIAQLLSSYPAMIKRPVLQTDDDQWILGYNNITQHYGDA